MYGPTEAKWADDFHQPKAMTEEDLQHVEDGFLSAIERCKAIGFDFIELHAAHGYLMSSFLFSAIWRLSARAVLYTSTLHRFW